MADSLVRVVEGRTTVVPFGAELLAPMVARAEAASATAEAVVPTLLGDRNLFKASEIITGQEIYGDPESELFGQLNAQADSRTTPLMPLAGASIATLSGLQPNPGFWRNVGFYGPGGRADIISVEIVPLGRNFASFIPPVGATSWSASVRQRFTDGAANAYSTVRATVSSAVWAGKRYGIFGDSRSQTENSSTGQHDYGSGFLPNWPDELAAEMNPLSIRNYALTGSHVADLDGLSAGQRLSQQIDEAITDNLEFDVTFVAFPGANDKNSEITLGLDLGTYETTMAKAYGSLDPEITMDAARLGLSRIQKRWPNAKKFLVLPFQRASVDPDDLLDFVDDLAKMARRHGHETIDLFGDSGIVYERERTTVTASVAGNVLTVTAADGNIPISAGQWLLHPDITYGTYIASLGTGSGGTGTYILDRTESLASTSLVLIGGDDTYDGLHRREPSKKDSNLIIARTRQALSGGAA